MKNVFTDLRFINRQTWVRLALIVGWVGLVGLSSVCEAKTQSEPEFDRLDGKGESGKEVNVIEWEGNLEIHVYPVGSLAGLSLKIDRTHKDRPVMVIGYRFQNRPQKTLIRRAILSIPLQDSFRTFRDFSAVEYDKIVISNHELSSDLKVFALDAEPKQLYPDGHPALADKKTVPDKDPVPVAVGSTKTSVPSRVPAEVVPPLVPSSPSGPAVDEWGTIQPFKW